MEIFNNAFPHLWSTTGGCKLQRGRHIIITAAAGVNCLILKSFPEGKEGTRRVEDPSKTQSAAIFNATFFFIIVPAYVARATREDASSWPANLSKILPPQDSPNLATDHLDGLSIVTKSHEKVSGLGLRNARKSMRQPFALEATILGGILGISGARASEPVLTHKSATQPFFFSPPSSPFYGPRWETVWKPLAPSPRVSLWR